MRRWLYALCAVALSGCTFSVDGVEHDADVSGADLAGADLAGADLAGVDLAGVDLSVADLSVPPDMTVVILPVGKLMGTQAIGPATLTLTGAGDWLHLGLNTAGDVNRKNLGAAQIQFANTGTLTRYTQYSTGVTWSDGTPTAAVVNSTAGDYVLGPGNGFTITVPADLTQRTLTLLLNVGGTGQLTASLSDASAANYVASASGANNGATVLYTLQYAATAPGRTLTVTWLLQSGTGVSLVAATLQ
jgi:hypothetical protein